MVPGTWDTAVVKTQLHSHEAHVVGVGGMGEKSKERREYIAQRLVIAAEERESNRNRKGVQRLKTAVS